MSEWISTITGILLLFLSMWWCLRQYYHARKKGYSSVPAATMVVGGALIAVITGAVLLDSFWYGTETMVALLLFPVPALLVTVLVALLPRRPRRGGARRSWFLASPISRALEIGLYVAGGAAIASSIFSFFTLRSNVIDIWPDARRGLKYLSDMNVLWGGLIFLFGARVLSFARKQLGAPGLVDTVAADTRPAVLYLRAFQQESEAFARVTWEYSRYTQRPFGPVTFEQYLGAEFAKQLGPLVALGNPFDSLPPEGAARSYAPDEDWQRHFSELANAAAAIVMDGSRSDNLRWELAEITRNGWQCKLLFLIAPESRSDGAFVRLVDTLRHLTKGVRTPRWEQFAAELKKVGLHVPPTEPDPGSVVAFDVDGRAEVLIRGADQPDEFVTAVHTRLERQRRLPARYPHQPPPDGSLEHVETGLTTSPPESPSTPTIGILHPANKDAAPR